MENVNNKICQFKRSQKGVKMKKGKKLWSAFSFLMTVCLLTGMLPATARAEEHSHMLCGGSNCTEIGHTCTAATTFTAWDNAEAMTQNGTTAEESLPTQPGCYF